jgi:hypothetical protein
MDGWKELRTEERMKEGRTDGTACGIASEHTSYCTKYSRNRL